MKYKSIKQGLVSPNILFTAAYLLFSAEICTSSPKDKSRQGIGNASLAIDQFKQTNKIEEISDPAGEVLCDDSNQLDPVLAIDSAEDDTLLDTEKTDKDTTDKDTTDTEITHIDTSTSSVEPLEQSVVQGEVNDLIDLSEDSSINPKYHVRPPYFNQEGPYATQEPLVPVPFIVGNDILGLSGVGDVNKDDVSPPSYTLPVADNSGRPSSNGVGNEHTHGVPPLSPILSSPEIDKNNDSTVDKNKSGGSPNQDLPTDLMEEIRAANQHLKDHKDRKIPEKSVDNTQNNSVGDILARRSALAGSDSESDDEPESYWEDDNSNDS